MAQSSGGSSSTLANMAAKRRQLSRTRQEMFNRGNVAQSTPGRAAPPPPVTPPNAGPPQAPVSPQSAEAAAAGMPDEAQLRQQRLAKVQSTLSQVQLGGQQSNPATSQPVSMEGDPNGLQGQLAMMGASSRDPEVQFYRIAGRHGSPREVAAFSTRLLLESQLGRVPTRGEVRNALAAGQPQTVAPPVAFEG